MLKIITLVCVLLSVLVALLIQAWLKSRRGQTEFAGRTYKFLLSRNRSFLRFNYLPLIVFIAVIGIAIGIGMSWKRAAVYVVGAVVSCAAVMIGSMGHVSGGTAAAYAGTQGDIRTALKASYRSGGVMGYCITAAALTLLGALFVLFKVNSAINASVYLALGASTAAVLLNVSGNVCASSYALAKDKKNAIDNTGIFTGSGADFMESYIMSAAAVMVLADLGVTTSGALSTFTEATAAKFILIVYAAGIVASIIGALLYVGGRNKDPRRSGRIGATAGCFVAAVLTGIATMYFSVNMLQSRVYGWVAISGMLAGLVIGEISKLNSQDSKGLIGGLKSDRRMGSHAPVMFNLGTGMISVMLQALMISAALYVSYNFANYYGIALCAAGFASVTAAVSSVSGLGITAADAASIIDVRYTGDDAVLITDSMETAAIRADISARSYSSTAALLACAAMLGGFAENAEMMTINLINISVFLAMIFGVASSFVLLGLVIEAVRQTGRAALGTFGRADASSDPTGFVRGAVIPVIVALIFPSAIGLLFGVGALAGFLAAALISGCILMTVMNNSGQYYERSASRSLGSLIKIMVMFSVAFLPVFVRVGGFL